MTTRVVLAWCWLLRVTRLELAVYALMGAYLQKQAPAPEPAVSQESVPRTMTRVEWAFLSGTDGVRCQDGTCISVVNGRYVGEQ